MIISLHHCHIKAVCFGIPVPSQISWVNGEQVAAGKHTSMEHILSAYQIYFNSQQLLCPNS